MWQVIRQAQGLSPNKSGVEQLSKIERFEFNRERLLSHEVRPFVPNINKRVFTKCYNSLRFEKLRRWLLDEDINIRVQALNEITKLFSERRENCVESLRYDFLTILLTMLCSESEYMQARLQAATILEILLKERSAQLQFLQVEKEEVNSMNSSSPCDRLLCVLTLQNEATSFDSDNCINVDGVKDDNPKIIPSDDNDSKSTIYYQLEQKRDLFAMVLRVIIACHSHFNNYELTEAFVKHKAIITLLKLISTYRCCKECVDDENNQVLLATVCATFIPLFDIKESVLSFIELDGVGLVSDMLHECSVCEKDKAKCVTSEKQQECEEEEEEEEELLTSNNETCDKNDVSVEASSTSSMLIAHVAEVLSRVSECPSGRRAAFEARTCEVLFPFIAHDNLTVRVEVHAALAQLTVLKENKQVIASRPQYLSTIKKVLEREDERDVLMFFVKTITNLAELPCIRSTLRKMCLERLHVILSLSGDDETLQTAINVALTLLNNVHEEHEVNTN